MLMWSLCILQTLFLDSRCLPLYESCSTKVEIRNSLSRGFPGGPVVKILHFHCKEHRFDSWSGN